MAYALAYSSSSGVETYIQILDPPTKVNQSVYAMLIYKVSILGPNPPKIIDGK
jgi:hypothetical protein